MVLDSSNVLIGEEGVVVEGFGGNWLGPWILVVRHWLLEPEKMVEGRDYSGLGGFDFEVTEEGASSLHRLSGR